MSSLRRRQGVAMTLPRIKLAFHRPYGNYGNYSRVIDSGSSWNRVG
jgi:hypothetical protein